MKAIKIIFICIFCAVIILPAALFNTEEPAVSEIDNRMLTGNPFKAVAERGGDLTESIENYVNDRIGLRDEMILAYSVMNDRVFGLLTHPSYVYGKDGYIFGKGTVLNASYSEFHETFVDMTASIQNYCLERGTPFLFVFEPSKPAIFPEYIEDGTNYDRKWVDEMFSALDERGIRYVDNTVTLKEKTSEGEVVFNKKYDANHWNRLGAYYGTLAALEELKRDFPSIYTIPFDELNISEETVTSLLVSKFPINERVPVITFDSDFESGKTGIYSDELRLDPEFPDFGYFTSERRMEEGAPRVLVFQGSYMNGNGFDFFANAFGEYIYVYSYQNVTDFEYYYNLFDPDCVIFEAAEYTMKEDFYGIAKMKSMRLNPVRSRVTAEAESVTNGSFNEDEIEIESGEILATLRFKKNIGADYMWLELDRDYDMERTDDGFEVTVPKDMMEKYLAEAKITAAVNDGVIIFDLKGMR